MRNKAKPNGPGKMKAKEYNKELRKLQARFCHLQDWVKQKGLRVIIIFEGRDGPEAALARADAVGRPAKAREAGNRSGQYLANTVLFATVLFFAGTAGKFEQPGVRLLSASAFGLAVFAFAVIRMLLMPAA